MTVTCTLPAFAFILLLFLIPSSLLLHAKSTHGQNKDVVHVRNETYTEATTMQSDVPVTDTCI